MDGIDFITIEEKSRVVSLIETTKEICAQISSRPSIAKPRITQILAIAVLRPLIYYLSRS